MADIGLYENLIEHARVLERVEFRRRRLELRNLDVAFQMPESEFVGLFRLSKPVCRDLIQELEPYLPSRRRDGISTVSKVLSALSFYASGSYQRTIGASAFHSMHQVSVSNSMRAVTAALNNEFFRRKYIKFPATPQERNHIKYGFYQKFGIPGVLGCVDGTHIAIVRPCEFEERFFNRKHYHSLNAQIVCDSELTITSVDASHGGADHDSFVWNHHALKPHLEQIHQIGNERVWFLGDSGYPLRATMMTPIINTLPDTPERYYTDIHCRTRCTVERCIGVLKSRWRCLLIDRKLHYHPTTAGFIANACAILHNIAHAARLPVPELTIEMQQMERNMQIVNIHPQEHRRRNALGAGDAIRSALVQRLWLSR